MTLFLTAFVAVQLLGLAAVLMAVRRAPVAVEGDGGFHVVRPAGAAGSTAMAIGPG